VTGIRRVRRPATPDSPAFDLAYVRSGPRTDTPLVVVPGGPGLASILPYRSLRRRAARGGLDLIMVEHRGVGYSRADTARLPLPVSALWVSAVVDDIAAVLDHERVRTAHIVGSSYGSYLASSFGVQHPERVAGMILDSALQSSDQIAFERRRLRELFWDAGTDVSRAVRGLIDDGVDARALLDVVRAAYELGGDDLLRPLLAARSTGRRTLGWRALEAYAVRDESIARVPRFYEFDRVGAIGFRELDYGAAPDGHPLDPALTYSRLAERFPPFAGEPHDLVEGARRFAWPTVLLVGGRDLRTPPAAALRSAERMPDATVVHIDNGHSALDTHPAALLNAMRYLAAGAAPGLASLGPQLDRLPRVGLVGRLTDVLRATAGVL
jgi:proline iminopeptidase